MAFFSRVLECEDGTWACRWGVREFDRQDERDEALDHITALAGEHRPSESVVHCQDGRRHTVATFEDTGHSDGPEQREMG